METHPDRWMNGRVDAYIPASPFAEYARTDRGLNVATREGAVEQFSSLGTKPSRRVGLHAPNAALLPDHRQNRKGDHMGRPRRGRAEDKPNKQKKKINCLSATVTRGRALENEEIL